MIAAISILLVIIIVGGILNPSKKEFAWFMNLKRPAWLNFERFIPLIWIFIYGCFYFSALTAWYKSWNPFIMLLYLILLLLVQSYTLVMCKQRKIKTGTLIAFAGWLWGGILLTQVVQISIISAVLLIPFLLWSPIGTFVTWQMQKIN